MISEIVSPKHLLALKFIASTLETHKIQYQVTGGLAGNIYGSKWPLHDIDIEMSQKNIEFVAELFREWTIRPLARFVDEEFDLMLLTLRLHDVEIDINQVEEAFVFTKDSRRIQLDIDLSRANKKDFLGFKLWVQPLEEIIKYKKILGRTDDVNDLIRLR